MSRVGLAVVTYKDNFGSALQTYATQKVLNDLGYETGIFRIDGVSQEINKKKIHFYGRRFFETEERKYLINYAKSKILRKKNNSQYAENMRIRHEKYEEFNRKYLRFFDLAQSMSELSEQSGRCEAVLVGSDQLWRPSNIVGGFFTLDFVPDKVKKVAYATSFGVPVIPSSLRKQTDYFLNRFDYISVRERTGQEIIKSITQREVPVVCDPTMLITTDQWLNIQEEVPFREGDYILFYCMGMNPVHRQFVQKLKEATGYRIIGLLHGSTYIPDDNDFVDEAPYDVGPCEFINLIRHAKYVCTDSFHGTVFSILNHRDFFTFRRFQDGSSFSTNDRLYTLLNWTGLDERMIAGDENVELCLRREIDYSIVAHRIGKYRDYSMNFLKTSLEEST